MEMERKGVRERERDGHGEETVKKRERECFGGTAEGEWEKVMRGERGERLYAVVMATDGRVAGCCFGPRRARTHKISRAPDAGKIKIRRIYISSVRY